MRGEDFGGWQERPRGRRARRDPDDEYGTQAGYGSRDVQEWGDDQPWHTGPGGSGESGPHGSAPGYGDPDRTGEQDPYGRTDPSGTAGYYGGQAYGPPGDYPSQPPVPRGDYPSQPPVPRGDYPSQPPVPDYPSHPSFPGGYDRDRYGQSYDDRPSYPGRSGYQPRAGYDSQEPYDSRTAFGEPDAFGGQDAYQGQNGYGAGAYSADNGYREAPTGYGSDYDGYGAPARSGPMPAYADDDQPWQAPRAADYDRTAARGRRGSAYRQEDVGHDGPPGGSRRSGRSMDADDDRHSGFFAGYASNDDDHYGGRPRRGRGRGRGRAAGMIALIIVVVLVAGLGLTGYHFYSEYKAAHASYAGSGYGTVDVIVKPGATAVSIAPELKNLGVIAAVDPFVKFVDGSSNPTGLQPGEFKLHKHMGNPQAWAMLTSAKNRVNSTVTIPDGLRYTRILPLLAKESHLPLSDFQAAIKQTSKLGLPSWANGNPEGFLYPATYDIVPGSTTALQILQTAVHQFSVEIAQVSLAATAKKDQFTELQVITGASLLEAEVSPKYYADVARTLDNRLQVNMPLQLDSTVAYATGHYTFNLSSSDLHFPSPYNTFLHTDLPPGPINSPDIAAIKAFLHPASSSNDWIYFVTVNKKGLTEFTSSKSQFDIWSSEAKQNGV